jgi:hypothetical protein
VRDVTAQRAAEDASVRRESAIAGASLSPRAPFR